MKGRKQARKYCNYKTGVALQCPVRKRSEREENLGTCTVLIPRRVVKFIAFVLEASTFGYEKNPKGDCTARL